VRKAVVSIVVLLCVLGLLVAADFGFRAASQARVAALLHQRLNTSRYPDVDIHGFPFLTQALAGDYGSVHLEASGVHPPGAPLRNLHFVAELHDVHVGLVSLLAGTANEVRVRKIDGQVRIGPSDISRSVTSSGLGRRLHLTNISVEPASAAQVLGVDRPPASWRAGRVSGMQLSAAIDVLGVRTRFTALTAVSLVRGGITITTKKVHISSGPISASVPPFVLGVLQRVFDVHLDPDSLPLPFAVTPTAVFAHHGSLILRGTARNVTFRFDSASGAPSQRLDPVSDPGRARYPGSRATDADATPRGRFPPRPVQPVLLPALTPRPPSPAGSDARAAASHVPPAHPPRTSRATNESENPQS
jgi:hypothetical protein